MADQTGRVAVVTGGGRGLGRGVALGLAAAGATVVAVARNEPQLAETERLAAGSPGAVTGIVCDVADIAAVAALAETVAARFGAPTILVNAAGVFGPIALIADTVSEDWVRTIQIDAVAPFLTVR